MIEIDVSATETSKPTVLTGNLFADGTLSPSSAEPGAEAGNVTSGGTHDFWTASTMPATLTVTLAAPAEADCCAIAAHNLGTIGARIDVQRWDGAAWITEATANPTDDSTIMVLFGALTSDQWRIRLSNTPSMPTIGVAMLGKRLIFPISIVGDYVPTNWGERIEVLGGKTISGQFLPQRIKGYGAETTVNIGRVDYTWHESIGLVFARHYNEGRPFFFAGWPEQLVNDVAFCRRSQNARELRAGIGEGYYASPSFDVECYVPPAVTPGGTLPGAQTTADMTFRGVPMTFRGAQMTYTS